MSEVNLSAWARLSEDAIKSQSKLNELVQEQKVLAEFKKSYIKIRTDNIVLDHRTAIELTKMIHSEANTLTFEDTQ